MYHNETLQAIPATKEPFKLEAVIVCNQYSDFLRNTLPNNKHQFDRVVVVTSPEDIDTQKFCEFYHVECVVTEAMRTADGHFCKGAGINAGLARLEKTGWVLHLDADIWLPPQTRHLLQLANLDKRMLYGIDRFNVRGFEAWQNFLRKPALQQEMGVYVHLDNHNFPVGTRVMIYGMDGYTPIGFFQLWNPKASGVFSYPQGHTTAAREDTQFAAKWKRGARGFIPEVIGYHLESSDAANAANWNGRKTSLFEAKPATNFWRRLWNIIRTILTYLAVS